jgi:hypothetical protein
MERPTLTPQAEKHMRSTTQEGIIVFLFSAWTAGDDPPQPKGNLTMDEALPSDADSCKMNVDHGK